MRRSLHDNRTYLQDSLAEQAPFFKSLFGEEKKKQFFISSLKITA